MALALPEPSQKKFGNHKLLQYLLEDHWHHLDSLAWHSIWDPIYPQTLGNSFSYKTYLFWKLMYAQDWLLTHFNVITEAFMGNSARESVLYSHKCRQM